MTTLIWCNIIWIVYSEILFWYWIYAADDSHLQFFVDMKNCNSLKSIFRIQSKHAKTDNIMFWLIRWFMKYKEDYNGNRAFSKCAEEWCRAVVFNINKDRW